MATDEIIDHYILSPERSPVLEDWDILNNNGHAHSFPSPVEVRANLLLRNSSGSYTTKFKTLNIAVKYGKYITASEAHCLRALKRLLPHEVPVPEVYGWCEDGGEIFIYMELITGVTLESQWESLSDMAKKKVSRQLRTAVSGLRKLQQDSSDQFLGRIDRKPLLDVVFTDETKPPAGPFRTVKDFHDWLSVLMKRGKEIHFADPSQVPDPFREFLPDNSRIVFTHADLHPSNIMMSADASGHILAVIDWHQSGWYPEYWEFCKALFTSDFVGDWATECIPQFVDVAECYDAWAWYPRSLGY